MNEKIKDFFDEKAASWDEGHTEQTFLAIEKILDRAVISPHDSVLDVACGTGVLVPFLLKRRIKDLTCLDLSEEMARLFKEKHPGVYHVLANYEEPFFTGQLFDKIIIFNAFPHFRREAAVFENSFRYLKPSGKLVIAHSMSREELNIHHKKAGEVVEHDILISDNYFKKLFKNAGFREIVVENSDYFFSSGIRPDQYTTPSY